MTRWTLAGMREAAKAIAKEYRQRMAIVIMSAIIAVIGITAGHAFQKVGALDVTPSSSTVVYQVNQ